MVGLHLLAEDLRRKEMFVACNDLRLILVCFKSCYFIEYFYVNIKILIYNYLLLLKILNIML